MFGIFSTMETKQNNLRLCYILGWISRNIRLFTNVLKFTQLN